MSEKKKHRFIKFVGLASIPVAYVGTGSYLFNKLFKIDHSYEERDLVDMLPDEYTIEAYRESLIDNINWFKSSNVIKVNTTSFDGLELDAVKLMNHQTNKFVILVHGFNTDRYALLEQARIFDELGFNLLMIDQRGWGNSKGEYTTFGFKESLDILSWIKLLIDTDENVRIGLYGVSMGASAVMMTLGYKLPKNVIFGIEDCGYTSLVDVLKNKFGTKFLNPAIDLKVKHEFGFNMSEINCVESMKRNLLPTLFIHGTSDEVLPYDMCMRLYDACAGFKQLSLIDGSGHAYNCYREEFKKAIIEFLKNID